MIRRYLGAIKRRTKKYIKLVFRIREDNVFLDPMKPREYDIWLKRHKVQPDYHNLRYSPLISILVWSKNRKRNIVGKSLKSILSQKYDNFEILVVGGSKNTKIWGSAEKRYDIKVFDTAKEALAESKGDFVAIMDDDGILEENALYEAVSLLNKNKKIDLIYTDEDEIDGWGKRSNPNFKSDWAPDTLLSTNYIARLAVLRKSIVKKIGGIRPEYTGMNDYDLYLRFTEMTDKIYHIASVLYHKQKIQQRNEETRDLGKRILEDTMKRRGLSADVITVEKNRYYYLKYNLSDKPLVSIVIPTRDLAKTTKVCIDSIFKKTKYKNYEVIVVNNNSVEKETFDLFEKYNKKYNNFKIINANFEFNYSRINNLAVEKSKGEYIVLLNNDTEVISPDWLEMMLGYASQEHIGAVGPKLLYPDETIQHVGVVLGIGVASHVFLAMNQESTVPGKRLSVPCDYSAVTAACLMVSRKKWDEVGGLEERLKVTYNDVDFNLKLLEKRYYNVCLPMVKLYHYESKSRGPEDTPEKRARFDWEQDFMYKKWTKRIRNDEFYNPNYTKRNTNYFLDAN